MGRKLKYPDGFKMIRVDIDTWDMIRALSAKDGMQVAPWLRWRLTLIENGVPVDSEESLVHRLFVNEHSKRNDIPYFTELELKRISNENPNRKRWGHYDKQKDGTWFFNYWRYYKEHPEERSCVAFAFEKYVENLKRSEENKISESESDEQ